MPPSRFCALNCSSHALCDLGQALQAPAMYFLLYRMRGMDLIYWNPSSPRMPVSYSKYLFHACSWVSVMSTAKEKPPQPGVCSIPKAFPFSERAICWLSYFQYRAHWWLWKGMSIAAAGPLEPSKQALSSPLCLWALCFQSLLLQGCLESSTPACQLPGPFPSPPPLPPSSPICIWNAAAGVLQREGSPVDRTVSCLVSLPWVRLNLSLLCERSLVASSLCLN